jgi:hypothetical protein
MHLCVVGNIDKIWKPHSCCGLVGFPAKKTTRVIFPLKKHMSAVFCLSHDTKWKHFEAFLARIVANLIQKFKTQSSAVTSQMTRWRRYTNGGHDDVTPTGVMTSLGPVVRRSTICMTSLRFNDVYHNAAMWYNHVIRKNITRLDCTLGNSKNLVEIFE